jgi:hypothetical protein
MRGLLLLSPLGDPGFRPPVGLLGSVARVTTQEGYSGDAYLRGDLLLTGAFFMFA